MKGFLFLVLMLCLQYEVIAQNNTTQSEYSLPRKPADDADMLWKKRVWREIEVYERENSPLRSEETDALASILLNGIKSGILKAYASEDTAFLHPLALQAIDTLSLCDASGLSSYARSYQHRLKMGDPDIKDTSAIRSCVFPQQVEFYEIKEDWIFNRNTGQMEVYIDAIAPAAYVHGVKKPLFWLHYPEIRNYISNYGVYDEGKKMNLSWAGYFESRKFSSMITCIPGGRNETKPDKHGKHKKKSKGDDSGTSHDVWVY